MAKATKIEVTFPRGGRAQFRSIRAVARMLSGNGTASGGLRRQIRQEGTMWFSLPVRNNLVYINE